MDLTKKIKRNKNSAFQVADGKAVIMLADNSNIFTVNQVGTEIWEILDSPKTIEEVLLTLTERYEENRKDEIEKDFMDFLGMCIKERIIDLEE